MQSRPQFPNPFKFLWRNRDTLLLAFLLAAAVWASAVLANDPNKEDIIEGNVPLQLIGMDPNLILLNSIPEEVVVRMRAPESVWQTLYANPELVSAVVDFSGVEKGSHLLQVQVNLNLSPAEILEIQPAELTVNLDELVEETRTVEIQTIGLPAAGFEVEKEGLLFTPEEVTVSGPASRVNLVTKVLGKVSVNQVRQDIITLSTLEAVDDENRQISNVIVTPNQANVTINISQIGGYRDVAVKVETTGQPANGYRLNFVAVIPPTVTLFSENEDLIADIPGFVSTLPIVLTDKTADFEISIGLDLEQTLIRVGEEQTVLVRIGIAPIETSV
jgi:YbbR domain-containing protein